MSVADVLEVNKVIVDDSIIILLNLLKFPFNVS